MLLSYFKQLGLVEGEISKHCKEVPLKTAPFSGFDVKVMGNLSLGVNAEQYYVYAIPSDGAGLQSIGRKDGPCTIFSQGIEGYGFNPRRCNPDQMLWIDEAGDVTIVDKHGATTL